MKLILLTLALVAAVAVAERKAVLFVGNAPEGGSADAARQTFIREQIAIFGSKEAAIGFGAHIYDTLDEYKEKDPVQYAEFFECPSWGDMCKAAKNLMQQGWQKNEIEVQTSITDANACYMANKDGVILLGGGKANMILKDCWEEDEAAQLTKAPFMHKSAVKFGVTKEALKEYLSKQTDKDVLLHYIGHGNIGTGGWYFEKREPSTTLTAAELAAIPKTAAPWKSLVIISEACFGLGGLNKQSTKLTELGIYVFSPVDVQTAYGAGFGSVMYTAFDKVSKEGPDKTMRDVAIQVMKNWKTDKDPLPGRHNLFSGRSLSVGGRANIEVSRFFPGAGAGAGAAPQSANKGSTPKTTGTGSAPKKSTGTGSAPKKSTGTAGQKPGFLEANARVLRKITKSF